MPQPLPVDVVSTWWDYFVDGVGVVSGLATAGALLIAALAYRQQVRATLRQQATKIVLDIHAGEGEAKQIIVKVVNTSDQPIRIVGYFVLPAGGRIQLEIRDSLPKTVVANDSSLLALVDGARSLYYADVHFTDAGNHHWQLRRDGRLEQWSRWKWWQHQKNEKRVEPPS